MECLSYCVAEKIELASLERFLRENTSLKINKHSRVLELVDPARPSSCYIFSNGVLVAWNLKRYQLSTYLTWARSYATAPLTLPLFEGYSCTYGEKTTIHPHYYFNIECIVLENHDDELKLSLSYGLARSIKLKYYENLLESLIERYTPLTKELSQTGQLRLSLKRVRHIIGDILAVKCELNLISNFLYQPKFFWQHPNLEDYFLLVERYMDIHKRADTLNQQLNTLNEIFLMCNSYIETKHSHHLEIIIVILILVEVVFSVLNLHF